MANNFPLLLQNMFLSKIDRDEQNFPQVGTLSVCKLKFTVFLLIIPRGELFFRSAKTVGNPLAEEIRYAYFAITLMTLFLGSNIKIRDFSLSSAYFLTYLYKFTAHSVSTIAEK